MGVFAVTGGSGGIGARTVMLLKNKRHETINLDWKKGDIQSDLSTPEGRQEAIDELHIFLVRSVYDKCTRKVFGNISKCKAQLFANNGLKFLIEIGRAHV